MAAPAQRWRPAEENTCSQPALFARSEGLVLLLGCDRAQRLGKSRKRFTANVSHELRTPLTTISGYAELMQSRMTEPADIRFSPGRSGSRRRLLQLIEDIMHLSKLDEGFVSGRLDRVDLLEAARAKPSGKTPKPPPTEISA